MVARKNLPECWSTLTRALAAVAVICSLWPVPAVAQTGNAAPEPTHLSSQQWQEDLKYLAAQMRVKHQALFHAMPEDEFEEAVTKLNADIPKLNEDQIYVRLAQLTAMVQDGHSGLTLRPSPGSDDTKDYIPVRFERYDDGVYVRAAAPEYADAVGGKVLKVGTTDWQPAIETLDSIQSHDPGNNGPQLAWTARTSLNCPRLLYGLGLTSARDSADFVIDRNGLVRTFTMRPSFSNSDWYLNSTAAGWVDARMKSAAIPSSRQHEDKFYWFTELPEDHAIYFQFNLVLNQGSEPLAAFADRLSQALEQPQVKRLVIDLRNNTGGDNTLLRPLLIALIRSKLNKRGGIYAITGPTTFSAAQNFVNRLESYAEIILVGAPTGENVNFYGDPAEITLPNSRLEAAMSQLWWQDKDPRDKRIATPPSVAVMDSFADYVNGKDAALERALTMPTPLTLAETLELGVSDGVQATVDRYKEYANDPAHKYLSDGEQRVNTLWIQAARGKSHTGRYHHFRIECADASRIRKRFRQSR